MKKSIFSIFICFLCLAACKEYSREEIDILLKSDDAQKLVRAFYVIGEERDSTFIKEIITNAYDPRVSHELQFNGISVYQSKMVALKKISGIQPPGQITSTPDFLIINFYCQWVNENTSIICDEETTKGKL